VAYMPNKSFFGESFVLELFWTINYALVMLLHVIQVPEKISCLLIGLIMPKSHLLLPNFLQVFV
jgi:hypothetical protein